MDSSDPQIVFDSAGNCNHCSNAITNLRNLLLKTQNNESKLSELVTEIKSNPGKDGFHAIMGISGGLDSSYLLHLLSSYDLKILAVHVDAGWNSIEAVKNINSLVGKLGIELETVVVNWEDVKDLQIAYLESGVTNQDVPQDHVYFSSLYKFAIKNEIKYVISGSNLVSESILPSSWGQNAMDGRQIKDIHKRFGSRKLKSYPITYLRQYLWKTLVTEELKVVSPLNYIEYDPTKAMTELRANYNWQEYGGKHRESKFTEFFQLIYLPERFAIDKRKAHLSSLIVSGHLTRDEAIEILNKQPINEIERDNLLRFVSAKLGLENGRLLNYLKMNFVNSNEFRNENYLRFVLPVAIKAKLIVKRIFG